MSEQNQMPEPKLGALSSEDPKDTTNDANNNIDLECEKLLKNTKRQVKQMMEEAVTKKVVHESSSSIMSLSVAVDACLSHGLKRRALGLFKTSSSAALIQKVAKHCKDAEEIHELMNNEEQSTSLGHAELAHRGSASGPSNRETGHLSKKTSSNPLSKRYLWIKLALIEKKLVSIVEHLADNSSRYYEPEALMSNYLCAQILCSLLVGPTAVEFSRSKTNERYQFEDPTAEELMERHKLANPIACLCQQWNRTPSLASESKKVHSDAHNQLSRSATDSSATLVKSERLPFSASLSVSNAFSSSGQSSHLTDTANLRSVNGSSATNQLNQRRRPLALKTNVRRGTLVTDCHHYSCQEFSEHQQTRGYSFLNASASCQPFSGQQTGSNNELLKSNSACSDACQQAEWPPWSPRVLHETLHQNARFNLLYAKNNVLLERQPNCTLAGYLSLHQTQSDLILKWLPNQMINGTKVCSCSSVKSACQTTESLQEVGASCLLGSQADIAENSQVISQSGALESSYLDLIVSISVSRIVLLNCKFDAPELNDQKDACNDIESEDSKTNASRNFGDTLILVEADGVQRAPFRFPKGGLKLFLSCLESGLHPTRYLDPALRFGGQVELNSAEVSLSQANGSEREHLSSRLNSIWRRLPSLKRKSSKSPSNEDQNNHDSPISSQSPSPIPREKLTGDDLVAHNRQSNSGTYVYRIVSMQQGDWPLQTPPHSALSIESSSSGSFVLSSNLQRTQAASSSGQKFRWSLSKLARFSTSGSVSSLGRSSTLSATINKNGSHASAATDMSGVCEQFNSIYPSETLIDGQQQKNDSEKSSSSTVNGTLASSRDLARIEAKLDDLKESMSEHILALRTQSVQTLCESMRKQIVARAFYGWLVHCRKTKIIRAHLTKLLNIVTDDSFTQEPEEESVFIQNDTAHHLLSSKLDFDAGLTHENWTMIMSKRKELSESELARLVSLLVYRGSIEDNRLRREVWPYLLGHYNYKDGIRKKGLKDKAMTKMYKQCGLEWIKIERIVRQRDRELLAANMARAINDKAPGGELHSNNSGVVQGEAVHDPTGCGPDERLTTVDSEFSSDSRVQTETKKDIALEGDQANHDSQDDKNKSRNIGKPAVMEKENLQNSTGFYSTSNKSSRRRRRRRPRLESTGSVDSDASITDQFGNNVHRIDKDVQRCDRNFWYFKDVSNLDKLRNVMCTYVWQHLDVGYVQGMCDLAAPFLVIFDNEVKAFSCFSQLMERMVCNFPHGCAMDQHFDSLKYLMRVLDPKLYEVLQSNGDYTHFYFCYRWLLLDFKREFTYEDVYQVWETIWSARYIVTDHFVIFLALAMVRYYRDIIIENNMDFTDTIKFFNEMAERHNAKKIIGLARDCVVELENLTRL